MLKHLRNKKKEVGEPTKLKNDAKMNISHNKHIPFAYSL